MAESATLTVRMSADTKKQLADLAGRTKRTRSSLAEAAISSYVASELRIVDAIERGRAEVRSGDVASHDDVMRTVHAIIEGARASG